MREKIQKLIDEGNAVTSTGLPYNMWLNHIEKFYRSENFNDKAIEDTIKQAKTFSNNSEWFKKHHPDNQHGNCQRNRTDLVSQCHNVSSELP